MKRFALPWLCALTVLLLAGCFEVETVVKVKPDGSGTIEQTVLVGKAMVKQIQEMQDQFKQGLNPSGAGAAKSDEFSLIDEAKLKEQASSMGEGVTFKSAKKVSTETGEGFTAIFAFTDIAKLKLDQNPASAAPKMGAATVQSGKKEAISFQFAKGKPAELTVLMPEQKADKPEKQEKQADATPSDNEKPDPATIAMMQQMFKGLRVAVAVEVDGSITSTDATYRDGARVTLMELDFGKLVADPKLLEKLASQKPESLEETKKLLKEVPGLKAEMNPKVNIKFQ